MASELPTDIILEIYHWYLAAEGWNPNNSGKRPILVFSAVCRSWRNVLTEMPFLWTTVVFSSVDKYNFDEFLQRSSPMPYNVFLQTLPRQAFEDRTNVFRQRQTNVNQVETILRHIDRLQTLKIQPNSYYELELCLARLQGATAENLRQIRVEIPPVLDITQDLPTFKPCFPNAPNLKHVSTPGKCAYMYPSDLTSVTSLDLFDIRFNIGDCRVVFGSLPNLVTLCLAFSSFRELMDPLHAQEVHAFEIKNLIEVQTVKYLSVDLPLLITRGQCPCLLPVFHFPNLEVLEISRRGTTFRGDDRSRRPKLNHFHPLTVQRWNEPSSPFRKIRFRGTGWRWTPDIFTPTVSNPAVPGFELFTKLVGLEWVDDVLTGASGPVEAPGLLNYMEAKLNTVHFTRVDELPPGHVEESASIVFRWLQSVRSLVNGPITAVFPKSLSYLTELKPMVEAYHGRLSVDFSDETPTIWDDAREGGYDVPSPSMTHRSKRGKSWCEVMHCLTSL
ncbi:hypothetical protein AN958_00952 [Leucoagaricus sp. SymC.cos]|nr:hypothetical protein AN958_00952 [Leucoagaricus sp. SymC.cos]